MAATPSLSRTAAARQVARGLFELRPAPPGRWMFALRAGICMGTPVFVGWLEGNTSAGLMASIGAFTSLYGSGRPYLSRASHLALIALSFAAVVMLGMWTQPHNLLVPIVVALIAMIATWLSNALQIGPPGAYLFTLACAAAGAMQGIQVSPVHAAGLVLSGGAFAWVMQMGGALFNPRGPERNAVANAARAVIGYMQAIETSQENAARHRAAFALHGTWSVLVNQQPAAARAGGELSRLRALNRSLHLLFADAMSSSYRGESVTEDVIKQVETIAARAHQPDGEISEADSIPLGHPTPRAALLEALQPESNAFRIILRVGVAAISVAVITSLLHFERAYWAVAATVLMLHQGFDWLRTLQRSIERLLGTWVGLLLAAALLSIHPQGLWLALTILILQFMIEMLVLRNYALAAICITGIALLIASGGHRIDDPTPYLLARGLDTLAGCVAALIVYRLIPPRAAERRIPDQLINVLRALKHCIPHLSRGTVTTLAARDARRTLQRATFALTHAFDDGVFGSSSERRAAEHLWPAIAAAERLAYRALSACWALERLGGRAEQEAAASMFPGDGAQRLEAALDELMRAVGKGVSPEAFGPLPSILEADMRTLREALAKVSS